MKRKIWSAMNSKTMGNGLKFILFVLLGCMLSGNMIGCVPGGRGEYVAKQNRKEKEEADKMMKSIMEALEEEDKDALKELFSDYALENAETLDENIDELINFFPGCEDGYKGNVSTHRTSDYGEITNVIMAKYTVTNGDDTYELHITFYVENDKKPEKIGLYIIEVMTEEGKPEGFKWRDEEDAPGIYVLE